MGKASYAESYTMPVAESGDTFSGVQFTLTVGGSAKDLTDATIEMTVKGAGTLSIGSGITVITALSGIFNIDAQVISYAANTYDYEIKFTFSDGTIKTYIEGTWTITD